MRLLTLIASLGLSALQVFGICVVLAIGLLADLILVTLRGAGLRARYAPMVALVAATVAVS